MIRSILDDDEYSESTKEKYDEFVKLRNESLGKWVCTKCGVDRTKDVCPKGYSAALTGECPMVGTAQ